ncbi:MAG: hypothetical protein AB8I08_27685 [Sandaracinaceae bacterium]
MDQRPRSQCQRFGWLVLALGCDNATAESITEATVERTVEVGRGIGSGITKGAQAGRQNTESTDGATVVGTSRSSIRTVEVASVRDEGTGCIVTLRFGNTQTGRFG